MMPIALTARLSPCPRLLLQLVLLFGLLLALASPHSATASSAKPHASASKTMDAKGKLLQKTDSHGRHYNAKGQYLGKTSSDGKHYDAKGKFTGKTVTTTSNGTISSKSYDARGKLLQSTDSRGRITDAKGKYQGNIKARAPHKTERRDAKGKLVSTTISDNPPGK
jgi:hypothetical protein